MSGSKCEGVLERGGVRLGTVRVVGRVEHDRRAAPDDLEPAGRGHLGERRPDQLLAERLRRRRTPRPRPARRRRSAPGGRRTAAGRPRRSGRAAPAGRRPGRRPRAPARRRRTPCPRGPRSRRPRRRGRISTSATSGVCSASTAVEPGLMIPAFSTAIAAGVVAEVLRVVDGDRQHDGDRAVGDVGGVPRPAHADLDDGRRRPARRRRRRTPSRRRSRRTTAGAAWSASTRWVYGATSLNARTNASSSSGSPSMEIRSLIRSTWGLVNRPVRRSRARSRVSIIRDVEVLPLVPVRWITG